MRQFNPAHFPRSDTQSFFVFNQFPTDVALAIFEHCSPFDLVQLGLSSRHLRAFIGANRCLWITAQASLLGLPPLPTVEASGNFSRSAYASWLFGGGLCTWCSEWTDSQPCNFVFRFRACSPSCNSLLLSHVLVALAKLCLIIV
ncbi:hypothetical protein B0H17DRAFT_1080380 [Mycena rosella]|uniref:F-box domain-containing protein n=1 Tax=Mycena rosella TaxID=1033263 RepID=A0AAD7D2W0_MYCRO|nr:hypothetical protein B0H17DRAFT_1080380 [Mycena rosella]